MDEALEKIKRLIEKYGNEAYKDGYREGKRVGYLQKEEELEAAKLNEEEMKHPNEV